MDDNLQRRGHEPVEVLLIEDREADAELAMIELERNNLANSVHWLKDGQAAIDYIAQRKTPLRLVLLDLKLPKVSGLEVLRALCADPVSKDVPVVVMTSSKEDRDVQKAYELGASSYIVKPVAFDSFSEIVSKVGLYWLIINQPPATPPPTPE